jgi:hypothetical protein
LIEFCGLVGTIIIDEDGIYDPRHPNDRLLLGMKGTMSELELSLFRQRSQEALKQKARRGALFLGVAAGYVRIRHNLMGTQGEHLEQVIISMSSGGRCSSARAGQLEDALRYARRVQDACDALDNPRLRAWIAMNAEPHLYKGDCEAVVHLVEKALPTACEIREWVVVLFSSAWLAIAYLKLGRSGDARRVLDRVFKEVPLRAFGSALHGVAFEQLVLAQLHLAAGDTSQALSAAGVALSIAEQYRLGLEQGAAQRVLGEVHQAMALGPRPKQRSAAASRCWRTFNRVPSWLRPSSPTAASGEATTI